VINKEYNSKRISDFTKDPFDQAPNEKDEEHKAEELAAQKAELKREMMMMEQEKLR